jgi:hypothetical protein
VQGDVLLNVEDSESEGVALAVQAAYSIAIMATYPMGLAPIRQALSGLFYDNQHPTTWPWPRHITVSVLVVVVCFVFALYVPVLEFVFGLTGATAGTASGPWSRPAAFAERNGRRRSWPGVMIVYILPPAMTLRLRHSELSTAYTAFLWGFMILGLGLGTHLRWGSAAVRACHWPLPHPGPAHRHLRHHVHGARLHRGPRRVGPALVSQPQPARRRDGVGIEPWPQTARGV